MHYNAKGATAASGSAGIVNWFKLAHHVFWTSVTHTTNCRAYYSIVLMAHLAVQAWHACRATIAQHLGNGCVYSGGISAEAICAMMPFFVVLLREHICILWGSVWKGRMWVWMWRLVSPHAQHQALSCQMQKESNALFPRCIFKSLCVPFDASPCTS